MKGRNFWYLVTLVAFVLLPLAGCSGGGSGTVVPGEKGTSLTVSGTVSEDGDAGKTLGKIVSAVTDPLSGTVSVLNAADSTVLASTSINADGSFSGLTFTLPATKSLIVFKATTNKSATPFYTITPIDLSNPPAAGIGVSNTISIAISQASTNIAATVSSALGLTGILGEAGNALPAGQTYATAASLVTQYGGQILAYNTSGLNLTGSLKETLLPAVDANNLTGDQLKNMVLDGAVTTVSIPGNNPIISFQVTNKTTGKGIRGLKNLSFVIAQLQPGVSGGPDEWLSYMVTSATSRPGSESTPSTTTGGMLIDNGDGSYVYKMGKNVKTVTGVTYDASLTHRVLVQAYLANGFVYDGNSAIVNPYLSHGATTPSGSYFSNPINIAYDFVPASGAPVTGMLQRDVVTAEACNECHTTLGTIHGGRIDTKFCAVCHTKQRGNGRTASTSTAGAFTAGSSTYIADGEVTGNFVTMVHKIHMGEGLTKTNYNYGGVLFNEIVYPKEVANCRQCHKAGAGAQGDNWQTRPSRQACGSCHDNINFATGANLKTGGAAHIAQANDDDCNTCHAVASSSLSPDKAHVTVNATPNNPNVPAGAVNFTYEISDVTVNASNEAVVTFRVLKDGAAVTFNAYSGTTDINAKDFVNSGLLTGFSGSPSFLVAYADGIDTTVDFNNKANGVAAAQPASISIAELATGAAGTLVAGATTGTYVATLKQAVGSRNTTTGALSAANLVPAAFPAVAKMRTVALQGYFTQAAGTNGIAANTARHTASVTKNVTGDAARRVVVDSTKCAKCHEFFEGHGGNRNYDMQVCTVCHVPNLSSSGRTVNLSHPEASQNLKDMIHSIHGSHMRTNPYKHTRAKSGSATVYDWSHVGYPAVLKNCETCHIPGTYDVELPAGVLPTTSVTTADTGVTTINLATSIVTNADTTTTVTNARKSGSLPNATDLVISPVTAACISCHDSGTAIAHMQLNGGQFNVPRSAAAGKVEQCAVCHGPGRSADVVTAHK